MTTFIVSDAAEGDLRDIVAFISPDSTAGAENLRVQLWAAMEMLASMPLLVRVRPELAEPNVRFWVVRSYLIVYRTDRESIEIVRVLSGFRDLSEQLPWHEPPPRVEESAGIDAVAMGFVCCETSGPMDGFRRLIAA